MATKAKSISAADLSKFTQAAVKAATGSGRIIKGPIWGYIAPEKLNAAKQLQLATGVATTIAANAKAAGAAGLRITPVVVHKPGKILAGFIERELSHEIL